MSTTSHGLGAAEEAPADDLTLRGTATSRFASAGKFRVLIAGGSVTGLMLANALEQADIDYLVLEKRDIAPPLGASISLLCHAGRIFEQLGLWKTVRDATLPLTARQHFDENGHLFDDSSIFVYLLGITHRPFLFMERQFYLQTLYDNLKDRSKVHARTGVAGYVSTETGVTVTTESGEKIEGSILIGADGVHSTVKQLMATSLEGTEPKAAENLRQGLTATYKGIFGTSHNHFANDASRPFLPGGAVHNVYYRNYSGVAAAGVDGYVFWFLFVKLDKPVSPPNVPRYTEADILDTLKVYGHKQLGDGYTFADLWASRKGGGMIAMEEGVLQRWFDKRVLLMGDSAAKSTINVGLGGNTAVEGVAAFINELYPLLQSKPEPTSDDIQGLFSRFDARHRPRSQACVNLSYQVTRFEAMDTWILRFARWLSPYIPDSLKAKVFLDFMAPAPTINFLPKPE